ncbi:peptidoglycan-binding protein [Methylocapsa palsarum]|uniref:Outer membrane protein OmpA n=1 Tax=Methylocapsa palsarum TaxID=1612308 RepID=A0A1I4AS63_9HYPH|nr:peptidoglycan-binding protein [Methylocapsa palsarum]SFK58731.1 Outer membrane protein OmpA [Methylocapsa palsarum]
MNSELNFESMPFSFYNTLAREDGGSELEEEAGRRSRGAYRARPKAQQRSWRKPSQSGFPAYAGFQKSVPARAAQRGRFPRGHGRWISSWGLVEPDAIAAAAPAGSEYIRWTQSALNDVLGLQMPVDGVPGSAMRSAVRSFQRNEGLPVDGVVGPDTERALLAARGRQPAGDGAPEPDAAAAGSKPAPGPSPAEPAEEMELEWETFNKPSGRAVMNKLLKFSPEPFESEFGEAFESFETEQSGFEQESSFNYARTPGPGAFAKPGVKPRQIPRGAPMPATRTRRRIDLGEVVICGGKPFAVLDHFKFDKSILRKDSTRDHLAQVDAIAREIMRRAARRKPVPSVCIVGHTDVSGKLDYNYGLGLRRAKAVKQALCMALGNQAGSLTFVVNSMGETDPAQSAATPAARAANRRVEVHLLSEPVQGEKCEALKKLPPEGPGCGVPRPSPAREREISQELQEWEQTAPRRAASVQPKLCLYLESSNSSHRNHFQHQAAGTARRIAAIGSPNAANCAPKVGATSFKTGADIIAAIRAAWECSGKKPLQTVHIFGHSFPSGVIGADAETGLYQNSYFLGAGTRANGARSIADIPTDILSENVIFVLHGCNQAYGCDERGDHDNFAQSLLEHLAGALKNPKVFGHYNSGCAGRNNSWCAYSKSAPKGKAHVGPDYIEPGGCTPPSKKELEFDFAASPASLGDSFRRSAYDPERAASPPVRPAFRLACGAGCAPRRQAECHAILDRALQDAIALARHAARKLSAKPMDMKTMRMFQFFFGREPSQASSAADKRTSAAVVAQRFLASAQELRGGRWSRFRCASPDASPNTHAITGGAREVVLHPRFWEGSPQPGGSRRAFRAGAILRAMLHQLFQEFVLHDPAEQRRGSARCYEAFALKLAGEGGARPDRPCAASA